MNGPWARYGQASGARAFNGFTAKASEPINSRAEDYKSPGDNSSPAGETIPAGIGASSYDGKVVWKSDFSVSSSGKVTASFVMLFSDCIFTSSFSLLKLYADGGLIVSNVAPLRQSGQAIRFKDGTQTAVDPLLTAALGAANATAWPGYCYAVFEDFDCTNYGNRIPLIRAVLAGAVTDIAASEDQSTLTFGAFGVGYANGAFTVDPVKGHHYQIVSNGNDDAYVVTVDIASLQEINRVPVFGIASFGVVDFPVALQGTDYIACSISEPTIRPALLNALTGELVAQLATVTGGGSDWELSPKRAMFLRSWDATKFLVVTEEREVYTYTGSPLGVFVVDVTNETLEYIIHPYSDPALGIGDVSIVGRSVEAGPLIDGVMSLWYTSGHLTEEGAVNVALVSDSTFASGSFYVETESGKAPNSIAYDPVRSVLVVYRADGSFVKLNAVTGAVLSTHSGAVTNFLINLWAEDISGAGEYRAFYHSHRPGYILATRGTVNGDIYEIDLSTLTATLLIDRSDFSNDDPAAVFFDQYLGYMTEGSSAAGIINKVTLGDTTPDTVDLVDVFTQLATYDDRFVVGDLAYTGFLGNECSGLKLENDTTIDNLETSIAELFDVKIVESDGDRKYIYPPRDGSFAITATIDPEDFVEDRTQTIEKTFGAGEEEFAGCAVSYFDIGSDYKRLEQSYNRPVGVYDVTRSKKKRTINTVLSLSASQALKLATLAVYRSVLGNETYSFGLVPGLSHIEPADILQFDFRGLTTIARIKEASLNADYTQEVLAYQYLQYADATFTGASLPEATPASSSLVTRLIYLDIPLLSYAHDLGGAGLVQYAQIAGYGEGTISGAIYKSPDGATFTSQGSQFGIAPVVGVVTAISGTPSDPSIVDTTNTITVLVSAGDIDEIAVGDRAAVGRNGRWCVITFDGVSALSGQATLSDILWGYDNGSEVWRDQVAVGDQFVLIDSAHYTRFRNEITDLDDSFFYKAANAAVPLGAVPTVSFAASGVAETPYAPINLDAEVDGADIDLTWDYRSRLATGTNPATHGEASLSFEIDIMDGVTVKRTLTATTNAKTYLSADITTDFGGIPSFLKFRVYMMSAVVGRGYVGEKIVQLADSNGLWVWLFNFRGG